MARETFNERGMIGDELSPPRETATLSMLSRVEFEIARTAIVGFDGHASFVDYVSNRDGLFIGLATAGIDARLVDVSLTSFCSWCAHSHLRRSENNLEVFASMVDALRRERAVSAVSHERTDRRREAAAAQDARGRWNVCVDARRYRQWLACLGLAPSARNLGVYASLLLEHWSEAP